MALMFGVSAFFSTTGPQQPLGQVLVVDESPVVLTTDATLTPHVVLVDRADADARLAAGTARDYYLVPAGWPAAPDVQRVVAEGSGASGQ